MSKVKSTNYPNSSHITEFRIKLLFWFKENARNFSWRDPSCSPYEKIVSEIFLQRTKAETVALYLPKILQKYTSWEDFAKAPIKEIGIYIKPLGLANQRSKTLSKLANSIGSLHGQIPSSRKDLEELPGIGQYLASAILLFVFDKKEPLLDVNMQRLLERYFGPSLRVDIRYDPYLQQLSREIVDCKTPIEVNFSILDFAAGICKIKNPLCNSCIFMEKCNYFNKMNLSRR